MLSLLKKTLEAVIDRPVDVKMEKVIDPDQLHGHLEKEDDRYHNDGRYNNERNHSNHKYHSDHRDDHSISEDGPDKEESRMKDLLPGWIRRTTK